MSYINFDPDGFTSEPITLKMLADADKAIQHVYASILPTVNGKDRECLLKVLQLAGDEVCSICYERNIDPLSLEYYDDASGMCISPYAPEQDLFS